MEEIDYVTNLRLENNFRVNAPVVIRPKVKEVWTNIAYWDAADVIDKR